MRSAFGTRTELTGFGLLLALLLTLPLSLGALGFPRPADRFNPSPVEGGPYDFVAHQLYEDSSPIDILLVGASYMWVGLDAKTIEDALQAQKPGAKVLLLGTNWRGEDLNYLLLRDILARRQVGMIVVSMPPGFDKASGPHPYANYWLTFHDDPTVLAGLGTLGQVQIYGANVLGAPRHLLSMVRPDLLAPSPFYASNGSFKSNPKALLDWERRPVEALHEPPPAIPVADMIYAPDRPGWFRFTGTPLTPYQRHFVDRLGTLLRDKKIKTVALNIPIYTRGVPSKDVVEERLDWSKALNTEIGLIGAPAATLWPDATPETLERYYYNTHLNYNGMRYFTAAVTPALLEAFSR